MGQKKQKCQVSLPLQFVVGISIKRLVYSWTSSVTNMQTDGIAGFAGLEFAGLENDGLENDGLENDEVEQEQTYILHTIK